MKVTASDHVSVTMEDTYMSPGLLCRAVGSGSVQELQAKGVEFISGPTYFRLTERSVSVCFSLDPYGNLLDLLEEYQFPCLI